MDVRGVIGGTSEEDCFSSESTVIVKAIGATFVRDLRIGDMVLSDDEGTYSKFYSKGHFNEEQPLAYLRIFNEVTKKPLEVSPGHMVFKASSNLPVPASSIKVGDFVKTIEGPSKVTAIKKILRTGLFNPMTLSGSIVVDGVVSSIHSEETGFEGDTAGWIYLSGHKIIHWHRVAQYIHAPHRIVCGRLDMCVETLDNKGLVPFHQLLMAVEQTAAKRQSTLFSAFVLLAVVILVAPFYTIELLLENAGIVLSGTCAVVGIGLVLLGIKVKVKSA